VLGQVRRAKTEAQVSMRAPVARLVVREVAERAALVRAGGDDLRDAGAIAELVVEVGEPGVEIALA
jgi:valyl-tRNA synthetase